MRKPNWRVVSAGALLMVLSMGFFVVMTGMAGSSNDPETLMRTVGEVCGAVGGLSAVMVVFGLVGKHVDDEPGHGPARSPGH